MYNILVLVVSILVGGLVFMEVGHGLFIFIDTYAPGYFPGCYSHYVRFGQTNFDAPRKFAWADLQGRSGICGAICFGLISLIFRWRQLGIAIPVLRAHLIVCLSGVVGMCVGGGGGYLLGITTPTCFRSTFQAGMQPWFNPAHVGIGFGASQGLLIGLSAGTLLVLTVAWRRSRNPLAISNGYYVVDKIDK